MLDPQPVSHVTGVTQIDTQFGTYPDPYASYEKFDVTPLENYSKPESRQSIQSTYDTTSVYDLAGNVRPDNVMHVNESVTLL
jgi:hypothetical protein